MFWVLENTKINKRILEKYIIILTHTIKYAIKKYLANLSVRKIWKLFYENMLQNISVPNNNLWCDPRI